jgi:ribosomal protein S18 acetylase RimI-like enzyme
MDLENQANIFLLAYFKQQPVAYVKMRNDRTYPEFNNDKVLEIERIYVLEQYQNNKIGCSLMDECIAIAKRDNYKWLWLGVNIDNHQAINFYKKYQFTVFGTKQFQLGNAVDDDYLMKLEVKV